jgi:two-component system, OmpR family, response regulator
MLYVYPAKVNVACDFMAPLKKEYTHMKTANRIKIFLVDDDAVFLKSMEIDFLQLGNFIVETFSSGEACINSIASSPDIIVLDYQLDGMDKNAMNGIETLDKIKQFNPDITVIILSAQDKIEVAVNCMHHKAFDYVVKSETAFVRLQKIIDTILHYQKMEKQISWYMERM